MIGNKTDLEGLNFMCDTMGSVKQGIFAKNSDRSPNEPQVVEWYPAAKHEEKKIKATYIEVEQVPYTHGFLLSRPVWLWGGEMGVNDCGVCIGNEAVFTKGAYGKTGLTGMDLLRLGLERSGSATQALSVIIELLERYGQGGNCGYDHDFFYDNSFLIMDKNELYILETAGSQWAYKKLPLGSISNRLQLTNADAFSGERCNFMKKHLEPLYSHFSGSKQRLMQTSGCIEDCITVEDFIKALRTHEEKNRFPLTGGSVTSTCMHAGGLVGDHTTSSMIVELKDTPLVWVTGCSTPCISLFKPYLFGSDVCMPVFLNGDKNAEKYWRERESFHRRVTGMRLPEDFYLELASIQKKWIHDAAGADRKNLKALCVLAPVEESEFYERWLSKLPEKKYGSIRFNRYWAKKNAKL
ncbi:MAG: peptidase U34 [Clostridiales bacterium]|nr:peptidase U34 [Clostridiales bacterium]